jgi:hypothetical protein
MAVDPDRFNDALRRLLESPPVDRSQFESRKTEVERLYRQLLEKAAPPGGEPEPGPDR